MISQIPFYQNLLCKKRERYIFDFPYPILYQNNTIQKRIVKNKPCIEYQNKNNEYYCKDGCNISFKSIQKKIAHHNRLDDECNKEKVNLYILLNEFQNCINKLNENNKFENSHELRELVKQYKKAKTLAFDKNKWNNFLN